jgi:hypothetical protein
MAEGERQRQQARQQQPDGHWQDAEDAASIPATLLATWHQRAGNQTVQRQLRSGAVRPDQILGLQQAIGNRAVQRVLQRVDALESQRAAEGVASSANSGEDRTGGTDALLQQAIAIVEAALAVPTVEALPTRARQGTAATREGMGNGVRLKSEQVDQLQTALTHLRALQGGGRAEDVRAACGPILQGARGEPPSASHAEPSDVPVQRMAAAVAGAPLLAGGPPGWAIYAGLVVVSLVATGVVMHEMARSRPREATRAEPRAEARPRGQPIIHMGNIHVQGDDIQVGSEPNYPWNRPTPMTKAEALAGLAAVRGMLSPRQVTFRDEAFIRAAAHITRTLHTAPPPLLRTFQNPNLIRDDRYSTRRVDIEIIRGQAFV